MRLLTRARATAARLYGRYALRHQIRWLTWWRHGRHHEAPIDPYKILWVDPASLDRFIDMDQAEFLRIRVVVGVADGDWDLEAIPIEEHFVYRSIRAHFDEGAPWDRTLIHAYAMEGVRAGVSTYHGCRTEEDLERRFDQLDHLYEVVRHHGYRSQKDLDRGTTATPLRRRRRRPEEFDEIVVHIDRHGRFVFLDGIHRLSIAKVLAVPKVPVCVLRRHATWQAHRNAVARDPAAFPPETFEHPDLADLAPRAAAVRG